MATVKKGTTVPAPQWWKHLRPLYKRLFWKRQRRADNKERGLQHHRLGLGHPTSLRSPRCPGPARPGQAR